MCTFIENYLHFIKNCIRPLYEKLKPLKSGFIENSNFENNKDPLGLALFKISLNFVMNNICMLLIIADFCLVVAC